MQQVLINHSRHVSSNYLKSSFAFLLLCFGKLEEMRSMIPERRKRRARVRKLPKDPIPDLVGDEKSA